MEVAEWESKCLSVYEILAVFMIWGLYYVYVKVYQLKGHDWHAVYLMERNKYSWHLSIFLYSVQGFWQPSTAEWLLKFKIFWQYLKMSLVC